MFPYKSVRHACHKYLGIGRECSVWILIGSRIQLNLSKQKSRYSLRWLNSPIEQNNVRSSIDLISLHSSLSQLVSGLSPGSVISQSRILIYFVIHQAEKVIAQFTEHHQLLVWGGDYGYRWERFFSPTIRHECHSEINSDCGYPFIDPKTKIIIIRRKHK